MTALARSTRIALGAAALVAVTLSACNNSSTTAAAAKLAAPTDSTTAPATTPSATADHPRRITVVGTGKATGTPDVMTIYMGVQTQAKDATSALTEASKAAQALIDSLRNDGVPAADVTTTNVSVYPNYDSTGRRITGYNASNDLIVKLRKLDKAGEIIDTASSQVGDAIRLNGVSFAIDDTTALTSDARVKAVTDARSHADQLAKAAGTSLGRVMTIDESVSSPTPPIYYAGADMAAKAASAAPVPLQPGSQDLSLQVTVTYELVG
jgi:uncharacterized protein YggE